MLARAWHRGKAHEPLIIVSCCITMVFMNWHMVGPVLPRFALDFGVTIAEVSLLISAFTLARVFLNFPAGALTERVGRRGVFLAGGLLVGLAPAAYLADISPPHVRGMSIGLYRTVGDIAGFIGPMALGAFAVAWTQGGSVVVNGVLVGLVGCVFALFARETAGARPVLYGRATGR